VLEEYETGKRPERGATRRKGFSPGGIIKDITF
jgi:hypothetical protein